MAKKLFVGNLSFDLTQDQFKNIFAVYGTVVSANIVMDKFSGRPKGFGFVEFENDTDAMKAMAELDNSEQAGRNIAVKEAIVKPEATPVMETPVVEETATLEEVPMAEAPIEEIPTEPEEPAI